MCPKGGFFRNASMSLPSTSDGLAIGSHNGFTPTVGFVGAHAGVDRERQHCRARFSQLFPAVGVSAFFASMSLTCSRFSIATRLSPCASRKGSMMLRYVNCVLFFTPMNSGERYSEPPNRPQYPRYGLICPDLQARRHLRIERLVGRPP